MTYSSKQIDIIGDGPVNFILTATAKEPGRVLVWYSAAALLTCTAFSFEKLSGSGPFRLELHQGRQEPLLPAGQHVDSLHTVCLDEIGEWSSAGGWQQGRGVHAVEPTLTDTDNNVQFFTFLLYATGRQSAGVGVRATMADS